MIDNGPYCLSNLNFFNPKLKLNASQDKNLIHTKSESGAPYTFNVVFQLKT